MRIGIVSPFLASDFADLLDAPSRARLAEVKGVMAPTVSLLAREWHRRGHELAIFCLNPGLAAPCVLQGERLTINNLPKRSNRQCLPDFYRAERRQIRQAVSGARPQVLSAQWTYEHAWAALQCGLPTMVTCHDTPLRYAWIINGWQMWYHAAIAWHVIRRAHRLVCVSPYTAQHIKRCFRPRAPVAMIPNGLSPDTFQRGQRRAPGKPLPKRPFTFCSVGTWGGLKNNQTLLKAFGRVRRREPESRLVFFGGHMGPGQAAEQWARQQDLQAGVVFSGMISRDGLLDFLETEADMMVQPSLVEAHPMVLIEAMACRVPVIGGRNSGGVAWTLEDGRSGFLCDVRDERALAETMLEAMHAPDQNRAMVEHAKASVESRFQIGPAAAANEEVLRQLLLNHPQARPANLR